MPFPRTTPLTLTTADVLELLADGATTAQIAEQFDCVSHSVVNRINILKERYGAKTHAEVVAKAIKAGDLSLGHIQSASIANRWYAFTKEERAILHHALRLMERHTNEREKAAVLANDVWATFTFDREAAVGASA
jgi:DNA-binding CsgD family transcriptional regulator